MLQALYTGNYARVITPYGLSDPFPLQRGVKQGCPMSPIIFNLFLEPLLEWLVDRRPRKARRNSPSQMTLRSSRVITPHSSDHVDGR